MCILNEAFVVCLQDRIKEWGKRYLQPIAEWFGIDFPDRVQKVASKTSYMNLSSKWRYCW